MFELRHNILSNVRTNVRKYVVSWLKHSRESTVIGWYPDEYTNFVLPTDGFLQIRFLFSIFAGSANRPSCEGNNGQIFLPDEENCLKFYQCWDNIRAHMDCAPGTKFDAKEKTCVWGINCD